jgi:hypothetical protein
MRHITALLLSLIVWAMLASAGVASAAPAQRYTLDDCVLVYEYDEETGETGEIPIGSICTQTQMTIVEKKRVAGVDEAGVPTYNITSNVTMHTCSQSYDAQGNFTFEDCRKAHYTEVTRQGETLVFRGHAEGRWEDPVRRCTLSETFAVIGGQIRRNDFRLECTPPFEGQLVVI